MARSLGKAPSESILLSITTQQAIEFLRRQREKGGDLLNNRPLKEGVYRAWENTSRGFLAKAFGSDPLNVNGFIDIGVTFRFTTAGLSEEYREKSRVEALNEQLAWLDGVLDMLQTEIELNSPMLVDPSTHQPEKDRSTDEGKGKIFIGHGSSPVWKDLRDFIQNRLSLEWDEFNREPAAGFTTEQRLQAMLDNASFAFLVMTAEDEHSDGTEHARENVIHEAGLFQERLGFSRAVILLEDGCSEFSNIRGLTQIRFPRENIMAKSEEIRHVLEREGILVRSYCRGDLR